LLATSQARPVALVPRDGQAWAGLLIPSGIGGGEAWKAPPAAFIPTVALEYFRPAQRQPCILMSRKQWMLIALAVVLGGLSLYLNHDRLGEKKIQIHHRSRPARPGDARSPVEPIFFAFDRALKLTSLQVIPVREAETKKYPQPIWHLISDSNSVPTADVTYGVPIEGMRPAVQGATPDPLEPRVKYRLLITAGALKLEHDFLPVARTR
jgi:hypothetical protein